jgi:hypothetical protein
MTYIDILHNIPEANLVVSLFLVRDNISVIAVYTHEEK